jgi:PAS domain-containing protein
MECTFTPEDTRYYWTNRCAGAQRERSVRYQTDNRPQAMHRCVSRTDLQHKPISSPKPIQIILARQLASSLAMPILIVDTAGTLIYFNEPAEVILGRRFEETGEIAADTWSTLFAIADEERNPIAQADRPMMMALSERKPYSRTVWMQCGREWRHVNITAYPLIGEAAQFLGATMIFWEI